MVQTPANIPLNLGEVELYGPTGARMPESWLQATLSSTYTSWSVDMWKASNAIDGNPDSNVHSQDGDTNPSLTITYPCPTGTTSLSRVVVVNRRDGNVKDRINSYVLDFMNAINTRDRPWFRFSGGKDVYNIDHPAGGQ